MGAHRNFSREGQTGVRGHGERGARAYNGGLGRNPQRGPEAEALVGGEALPEAESFETIAHLNKVHKLLSICPDRQNMALTVSKQTPPSPVGPHW